MAYEYDEEKSKATLRERGFDFDFAARIFDDDFIEYEDQRRDFGDATSQLERWKVRCSPWSTPGGTIDDALSQPGGPAGGNEMPTAERSGKGPARTGTVDWNRVRATTDREIARQIVEDPDTAPDLTEEALDRSVIVGPNGKRTPYRHRGERRGGECLAPGTEAPRSGQYEIIGPRGGRTGEERTVNKGERLPPTPASGQRYRPVFSNRRRPGA